MAEKFALSMTNNPHVVKLYYSFQSPEALYLVMEYLIGGDLASLLQGVGRSRAWVRVRAVSASVSVRRTPLWYPIDFWF